MLFEPAFDRGNSDILILFVLLRSLYCCSKGHEVSREGVLRGSGDPQDGLVLLPVAIGILNGGLCLANATQTANRLCLGQRCSSTMNEVLMQVCEQLFASRKERIAPKWYVPDLNRLLATLAERRNQQVHHIFLHLCGQCFHGGEPEDCQSLGLSHLLDALQKGR